MRLPGGLILLGSLTLWASLPLASGDLGICILPPDGGLCFVLERRWYYDYELKKCLPFSWGGCAGNENNFETRKKCEAACSRYGAGAKKNNKKKRGELRHSPHQILFTTKDQVQKG